MEDARIKLEEKKTESFNMAILRDRSGGNTLLIEGRR